MGLTKQYLRYVQSGVCNVIGSTWSNFVVVDKPNIKGPLCAVGTCENVTVWDLRKNEKHVVLQSEDFQQTTCVAKSPDGTHVAAGFKNGAIKVFNMYENEHVLTFVGHKSPVSCLNYDHDGMRLVSGGMDTDIVVWDVVAQSGLYRLKGHKKVVTQARFMKNKNVLVSSSKDTLVKFWDLTSQHCFKTLLANQPEEIYDFILAKNDSLLITGSETITLWKLDLTHNTDEPSSKKIKFDENEACDMDFIEATSLGSVVMSGKGHILSMCQDSTGVYFGCHGTDRKIEIYKFCDDSESQKHFKKRVKKATLIGVDTTSMKRDISDEFKNVGVYMLPYPPKTFQILSSNEDQMKVVVMFRNNSFGNFDIRLKNKDIKDEIIYKSMFSTHGHLKEPLSISFSSDNFAFLSASRDSIKVWNRTSLQCFRTIACKDAKCSTYALADTAAVIGTQCGQIEVYDIASSELVQSIHAHDKGVNVICQAGKAGLVSGGSDKHVVFWTMELKVGPNMLTSKRRVKVADEVLCMSYSADQRYLAIGCLDSKAYVFYADTMNMLHTLYYHHQPITCIDISSDSHFIATGSGDKDIKIWSMQFGECLKIMKVAHEDKITSLQFIPKTHMMFSCGRDGKVKQWDCDNFQLILTLEGHQGPVNSISVSPNGKMLVSASNDMSVRLWMKTDEILVLEDEKEMAEEKAEEGNMRENIQVPGESGLEVGVAGKKTAETLTAVEKLCDALDLYKEEKENFLEYQRKCKLENKELPKPSVNLLFQALRVTTPEDYLLETLKSIRSSELHESLLVLPFSYAQRIIPILCDLSEAKQEVELVSNCLFFLLRVHAGQVVSNNLFQPVLERVHNTAIPELKQLKDVIGYNLVGLKFLQQIVETSGSEEIFREAIKKHQSKKKSKKTMLIIKS